MTKKSTRRPIVVGQLLPPQDEGRIRKLQLIKRQATHDARRLGLLDWPQQVTLPGLPVHPAALFIDQAILAAKGGKGKGGGGKKKWPDANMVHAEVLKMQGDKPVAGDSGNVVSGTQNCELCNATKVNYFADTYKDTIDPFHIFRLQEVDKGAVKAMAKLTGYTGYCCDENSRGQAVGFLVHPRLEVVNGPIHYDDFKNVQNGAIPDLRPAYRIDWHDTVLTKQEGKKRIVVDVTVHPKSMLGGPKSTGAIRALQFDSLMKNLAPEIQAIDNKDQNAPWGIIIAGDFNFIAWKGFDEVKPLRNNGFRMVAPNDRRTTNVYSDDSRIDYIFVKGFDGMGDDYYGLLQYFKNKKLGRSFTDHGREEHQITMISKDSTSSTDYNTGSDSSSAGTSGGSGGGDSKTKSAVVGASHQHADGAVAAMAGFEVGTLLDASYPYLKQYAQVGKRSRRKTPSRRIKI